MTAELAITKPTGLSQVQGIAQHFVRSGYFQDANDVSKAVVKILAGAEMGYGPFASMKGVHIIKGQTAVAAKLMAASIARSGKYRYRIRAHSDQECSIEFFEGKESLGVSTFTLKDAEKANLLNNPTWKAYPRNMLFARAMSNGAGWYCADIFAGPVFTPEELGAEVDEEGDVIAPPAPVVRMLPPAEERAVEAEVATPPAPSLDLKATLTWIQTLPAAEMWDGAQRKAMKRLCDEVLPKEAKRFGLELPARTAEMDPAAWATNAIMSLAERDDSSPF